MSFEQRLSEAAKQIEAHFDHIFADMPREPVHAAMRYALQGGKALRGFLVLQSADLFDVAPQNAICAAAAIEAIHGYSLIHDDLPCMDDDDLRRGRPTVHRKWDEATAVLAGDGLQSLAFEMLGAPPAHPDPARRATLVYTLAKAAGARGMVYGQALDIAAESAATPLDLKQITRLQEGKTGALISWSCCAGAYLADEDPAPLARYAKQVGLAFQIADDLLDVEGDPQKAGKKLQKDAAAGKATFVSLLGVAGARQNARDLVEAGCAELSRYGARAEGLRQAARFVIARTH